MIYAFFASMCVLVVVVSGAVGYRKGWNRKRLLTAREEVPALPPASPNSNGHPFREHIDSGIMVSEKEAEAEPKKKWKNGELVYRLTWWQNLIVGFHDWNPHPDGVVVKLGNQLLVNGQSEIYHSKLPFDWRFGPSGLVVRFGDNFLRGGKELICTAICASWNPHPEGIVVRRNRDLFLNGAKNPLVNGCDAVCQHPEGIVFLKDQSLFLVRAGETKQELIYPKGDEPKPQGACWSAVWGKVIVVKDNLLLLEGKKLLYCGPKNGWSQHPDGVIVRRGREFRFYNGEES